MLYVAYGSNLNVEQMKSRCPHAAVACKGQINDHRLVFKGSKTGSYLTIDKSVGHMVPVVVWEIDVEDEKNLDVYEGYPTFYRKENIVVETEHGELIEAMVYIMNGNRIGAPSNAYMKTCADGYKHFGFSLRYLRDAYDFSAKWDDGAY